MRTQNSLIRLHANITNKDLSEFSLVDSGGFITQRLIYELLLNKLLHIHIYHSMATHIYYHQTEVLLFVYENKIPKSYFIIH